MPRENADSEDVTKITISLPADLVRRMDELARKHDRSRSNTAKRLIEFAIDDDRAGARVAG